MLLYGFFYILCHMCLGSSGESNSYYRNSHTCSYQPIVDYQGTCHKFVGFFYFDIQARNCLQFHRGTCPLRDNYFPTVQQCLQYCGHLIPTMAIENSTPRPNGKPPNDRSHIPLTTKNPRNPANVNPVVYQNQKVCFNQMKSFDCLDHTSYGVKVWYYDIWTGVCKECKFVGNEKFANKFSNLDQCYLLCRVVPLEWTVRICDATDCGENAECNHLAPFQCRCKIGFRRTLLRVDCEDIDECLEMPNICGSQTCHNSLGSFNCL